MTTILLVIALAQAPAEMAPPAAGTLEGRPRAEHTSPLQALVDGAAPGDRIVVTSGTYRGDLYIDRPVALVGQGRPVLEGSGTGSVVRIRAAGVVFSGFVIDGRSGGDLGRDASGIHIAAPDVRVEDCEVRNSLFGIYLREAHGASIARCRIDGIPGRAPGEIGSGIHIWNTNRFVVDDNAIVGTRDGIYIQSSNFGIIRRNRARDLRYGLHYMFSDDNLFEDNTFERGAAGTAVMNSRRITFRRNRFLRNRGFASVGLLLKTCEDVVAEDNLIADNARGVFLEGSYRNQFRRNVIAMSDEALVLYDSVRDNVFQGNIFVGNLTPMTLVGRRTDTRFEGNFWSDHRSLDLDEDGIADREYRLSSVFDHLRGNLNAADLFARGPGATALAAAEQAFPVLDAVPVVDARPLLRAPRLDAVPATSETRNRSLPAMLMSFGLLGGGVAVLVLGGRASRVRAA
jgi:nitrous oxidase accessory protein